MHHIPRSIEFNFITEPYIKIFRSAEADGRNILFPQPSPSSSVTWILLRRSPRPWGLEWPSRAELVIRDRDSRSTADLINKDKRDATDVRQEIEPPSRHVLQLLWRFYNNHYIESRRYARNGRKSIVVALIVQMIQTSIRFSDVRIDRGMTRRNYACGFFMWNHGKTSKTDMFVRFCFCWFS